MEGELYTVPEFSQQIRCGKTKAYEMVAKRQVASIKIGAQVFVPKSAVITLLEQSLRPVFDAESEASALLNKHKQTAIQKTAKRKASISRSRPHPPEAA